MQILTVIDDIKLVILNPTVLFFTALLFIILIWCLITRIKYIFFIKKAIPVKATVIDIKNVLKPEQNAGYMLTLEVNYLGEKAKAKVYSEDLVELYTEKDALFAKGIFKNTLTTEGKGFYIAPYAELFIISFIYLLLHLFAYDILKLSDTILIIGIVAYFIILSITLTIYTKFIKKSNQKGNNVSRFYQKQREELEKQELNKDKDSE